MYISSEKERKRIIANSIPENIETKILTVKEKKWGVSNGEFDDYHIYQLFFTDNTNIRVSDKDYKRINVGDRLAIVLLNKCNMKLAYSLRHCSLDFIDLSLFD